jgi:hypothetical protein
MIDKIPDAPAMIFDLVKKAFSFQNGALAIIGTPIGIGIKNFWQMIFENVPDKELAMPALLFAVCLIAFFLVTIYDFFTGLMASKKDHLESTGSARGYIKSDKLWSSIWKVQGVIMIGSLLTLFTYIFLATDYTTTAGVLQAGIPIFFIIVILFEVHSIGENHFRRYGKKPKHFDFMDDVSEAVKKGVIDKIRKLF